MADQLDPKTFLFYLGHPAHFHNVARVASKLYSENHKIVFVAREKDVLFSLLDGLPYKVYFLKARKPAGYIGLTLSVLNRERLMFGIVLKEKPHVMLGTDLVIAHIGKVLRVPSIILNEDDAEAVPLLARFGYPFATAIMAPNCCEVGDFSNKKIGYEGYHELAYLHPKYFSPAKHKIRHLFVEGKPYFLMRFAKLSAHHDKGKTGITNEFAWEIIKLLEPYGNVFISSERKIDASLEPYQIKLNPKEIHHALAYANLYIGDSQTMAAEAAVLGTPSLRFNDFVGELSYLDELEKKYQLTFGIPSSKPEILIKNIKKIVSNKDVKELWLRRRTRMLSDKIDVVEFFQENLIKYASKK